MHIVVVGDRIAVGLDLPEYERLDEAPDRRYWMRVAHSFAQPKRTQHVAADIDAAVEKGFADIALVERRDGFEGARIVELDCKTRCAFAEAVNGACIGHDLEWHGRPVEMSRQA